MANLTLYLQTAANILAGVCVLATALAHLLPAAWPFTRFCARVGVDIKGISRYLPPPSEIPTLPPESP